MGLQRIDFLRSGFGETVEVLADMVKTVFKSTSSKATDRFSVRQGADELIYREGELGIEMYVIQDGQVEILKQFNGQERRLAVLSPGDFFGEMALLEDKPRATSARALGEVRLVPVNRSTLSTMLKKNPEIAVGMMRKISRRLRDTDQSLRQVLGSSDPGQVSRVGADGGVGAKGPERLVQEGTGIEFYLAAGSETTVGRRDPVTGINPDIDLTPADTQRSISRRHAKIFRRGDKFYLREEIGTMNGTFINGERVETGVPVEFHEGDEVRFGLIKTIFHLT